jgi:DNA invertase Pin-like site-specific DNA recombinase
MTSSSGEPQPAENTSGEPSRLVYGYLRPINGPTCAQQAQTDIRDYAAEHGYQLAGIITDTGDRHDNPQRPGITQLLEAITPPDISAVIIPGRRHLSPDPAILDQLIRRILDTGCHLLVVWDGRLPSPDQPQQPRQPRQPLHCGSQA